jgi:CysZ protein
VDNVADLVIAPGAWWRTVLRALLMVGLPLVLVVLSAFTYTLLCFVVAGPLYDWLSAAVERRLTGRVAEEPSSLRNVLVDFGRSIWLAALMLLTELGVLLVGLLLVPVTTVLAVAASAVLLALEFLDYPMGRRRMTIRQRLAFASRHRWELLGFGLPMLLGLMVPFVGAAFLPVGVVGGTVLFLQLDHCGAVPGDGEA